MAGARPFPKEKLILGLLYRDEELYSRVRPKLQGRFGPLEFESPPLPFDYSDYYAEEMGENLIRRLLSFERLVDPARLASIKVMTNRLEKRFSAAGRRRVNLDPGLLDLNRLVLATAKHSGHRIPLSKGIYAELTLHYRAKAFHPFPWTYPDYKSEVYQRILLKMREKLRLQLKRRD